MNIMEYRAIKAQEESAKTAPTQTQVTETKSTETQVTETKPTVTTTQTPSPEDNSIVINGEKVTLDELKNGYLRQTDYTKKTQEVAKQRNEVQEAVKFYENLKANPQLVTQLQQVTKVPPQLDPATAKVIELEGKVYDMMLEREISTLQSKYNDFEIKDVLEVAQEKNITNLEDAYFIAKARKGTSTVQPVNTVDLEKQIRDKILRELEAEKNATQTIITSNSSQAPVESNEPKISPAEQKVARMMFRNVADPNAEYIKWRDTNKRVK